MKSVMYLSLPLLLPLALHAAVVRQAGLSTQPDRKAEKDEPAVVRAENHVRRHAKSVMNAIDKYRAEVCYKMKEQFGIEFKTFRACHKFMKKVCKPGKDMEMDGGSGEVTSGKGYCKKYFPPEEKKIKCEILATGTKCESAGCKWDGSTCTAKCGTLTDGGICKSQAGCSWDGSKCKASPAAIKAEPSAAPSSAPASAPSSAPAPAKAGEAAPAPAKAASSPAGGAGLAPAPGPQLAGSPGPAPVPAPFIPGISSGKPWGPIGDDEEWYYKKGGKDGDRLHMSEDMKLPTQGYWGKLVEHDDMETSTGDWGQEFGPKAGHSSVGAICRERPDNEWCRAQGYGRHLRSACLAGASPLVALMVLLLPNVMLQ